MGTGWLCGDRRDQQYWMGRRRLNALTSFSNDETLCKSWFFLDIDAKRLRGISSTEDELNAAVEVGRAAREWLLSAGVPATALLTAKSGNGAYVLVRLPDYEITPELTATTAAFTKHIAGLFGTDQVKIDDAVHNAARLICALGTMKVKGENIADVHTGVHLLAPRAVRSLTRSGRSDVSRSTCLL